MTADRAAFAPAPPSMALLHDPAGLDPITAQLRASDDPAAAFTWFRRLLLLKGAYRSRDMLALDGDVIRKGLRAGAAAPLGDLERLACASPRGKRTVTAFVAACLLVSGRRAEALRGRPPVEYRSRDYDFAKSLALLAEDPVPDSVFDAQILTLELSYLAGLLRNGGFPDLAAEVGRRVAALGRRVRKRVDGSGPRAFTDRWTFAIGHMVVLTYLAKAQGAGLADYRGIRLWNGFVANDYLMQRLATLATDFARVKPFSALGDVHSANHAEWFEGAYRNYFDTCGLIAERTGDASGAILPRPTPEDPTIAAFLESAGLHPTDRIVTLHCRESGFKGDDRHDLRNVDIATCLPALRRLTGLGFTVVRMGDRSMTPLPAIPGVFDYARSELKSPELDVLLPGAAEFHIGSSSGLSLVPLLFGTPCLYLNWYPLGLLPWGRRNWTIARPLLHADGSGPVTDPQVYFDLGRMADRTLLGVHGVRPGALDAGQVTQAVTGFLNALKTAAQAPRSGLNRGRMLVVTGAQGTPFRDIAGRAPAPETTAAS